MVAEVFVFEEKLDYRLCQLDKAVARQLLHAATGVTRPDLVIVAGAGVRYGRGMHIAAREVSAAIVHLGDQICQVFRKNASHIVGKFAALKAYFGCFHSHLHQLCR